VTSTTDTIAAETERIRARRESAIAADVALESAECRAWEEWNAAGLTSSEWAASPLGQALAAGLNALEAMIAPRAGRASGDLLSAHCAYVTDCRANRGDERAQRAQRNTPSMTRIAGTIGGDGLYRVDY
jgi:hypothetical protein